MDEAGSCASGGGFRPGVDSLDEPPNSRIFLVISKYTPESVLRERFSPFGEIQDIWVVRDKHTKESKGIAFVKFARSSQACRAMEEMHGQCLSPNDTKPIKVFIAQSRSSGSHRDVEDEELTRIFVMIPKSYTEEDLREKFKVYGDIEYCSIIKNKVTGESKGLGYVRYLKPSQAAQAIENCDRSFRAILAEPKNKASESSEQDYYSNMRQETLGHEPRVNMFPFGKWESEFSSFDKNDNRGQEAISKRLSVVSRVPFTEEQLFSIFDIVPGLEYCEVQRDPYSNYGHGVVQYFNVASAIYAKYKLHGFQYPPGNRIGVSFIDDGSNATDLLRKMATQMVAAQLASMVWNNPSQQQFLQFGGSSGSQMPQIQTDVVLPSCKKKAPPETPVKERLFIVFNPHPLPLDVLEDIFCRFGNLIEVYLVSGKNVGYAKYADRISANDAITALHGKILNGVRLKVMLADSPREESNKRQRTY
ncbi:RNA-binding protein 45 isoform X1 [Diceros bicornis minor]|uniref:RNA-binding protein 45 isoform X1 n=1 Tax=Diceros bicornis minor TaxID=77932 RepID=UPI0026EB7996|nr:RNA-binding protein 45 isoform X1 [Diceros bicornis minor]XP_058405304.1 RNA-binding protein 45 isoform X1 [Diceros bicornis minor]XP_058405305.1 RNA-binding protein 45 isoform X1 [Diceros bicornis minor]